jgi:hypothetical protein
VGLDKYCKLDYFRQDTTNIPFFLILFVLSKSVKGIGQSIFICFRDFYCVFLGVLMMKTFHIAVLFIFLAVITSGINAGINPYLRPRNNVNLSLFGDASIISINYENLFANNRKFFLAGKAGIGYSESMGLPNKNTSLLSFPAHITGNYGGRKHYFEFGFGGTLLFYGKFTYWDYCIYPMIGYRFQPLKKDKVSFRIFAGYPVTDNIDIHNYWFFPVGISLGFCF